VSQAARALDKEQPTSPANAGDKPPPIGYLDKTVHGGFGVMLDDLIAAFYTLLCLAFWKTLIE
jgi:hypothetical protein